jgi:hypothetical protein
MEMVGSVKETKLLPLTASPLLDTEVKDILLRTPVDSDINQYPPDPFELFQYEALYMGLVMALFQPETPLILVRDGVLLIS